MKVDPRMPGTGPPAIEPPGLLSELQPRAIAVGVAVDLIATLVTNAVLMVVLATRQGHAASEIPPEVIEEVMLSPEGLLAGFVVGSLCTVLGGYVAGRP